MPIVRNSQTNDLYRYEGENKFTNLRTLKSGVVSDDVANKIFKINLAATSIINEFPMVGELISRLNLKIENQNAKIQFNHKAKKVQVL